MRCILCGKPRIANDLIVFSPEGFRQTMSIFNITPVEGKKIAEKVKKYLPIHVCPEHLQTLKLRVGTKGWMKVIREP
ncbi:MAG: hypothetical protein ABH865_07880 [Candidatus Omnitrophota bacterium]